MGILLIYLLVLGLLTVVGHFVWVMLAELGRTLFGGDTKQPPLLRWQEQLHTSPPSGQRCDDCGGALEANSSVCGACGKARKVTEDAALNDLDATERQLRRWQERGVLDELKSEWLTHIVAEERQRLTQSAPAPAKPAQPEPIVVPSMPEPTRPPPGEAQAEAPLAMTTSEAAPTEPNVDESPATPPQPAGATAVPAPRPQPPAPPKSLAEMLAAFMEERNIRWGELLGGMLIIGCSLALVISLWSQIEQIPLLKFFIFTAMTGAFAGLGLYSEHRWKLPNTSRGLLITATMLVPLNCLAIAAVARDMSARDPVVIASELTSLALLVLLVYRAGKVIQPGWQHWLTLGVVGAAATQFVLRRVADVDTTTIELCGLAALPITAYVLANLGMLAAIHEDHSTDVTRVTQAFTLLGATSFSALVTLGLLIFKTQAFVVTLQHLAPMVSTLALPALLVSITLWQRVRDKPPQYLSVVSASTFVLSAMLMAASLLFAQPNARPLLLVALINGAALTLVAFAFRLPVAHLFALPCVVLAYVIGVNLALGRVGSSSLLVLLLSVMSGKALALLLVGLVGASEWLVKHEREKDGLYYRSIAAAVSTLSFLLVSWHGFGRTGDPQQISWVYALLAATAFYLAVRLNQVLVSYGGLGLTLLAGVQLLHFGLGRSVTVTSLSCATAALVAAVVLQRGRVRELVALPSRHAAWLLSIVSGAALLFTAPANTAPVLCGHSVWLAALTAALAWLYRSPAWFTAFQALTYATVFFAVTAMTHGTSVFAALPLDFRGVRPQMVALALLSAAWIVLLLVLRKAGITRAAASTEPTAWQHTAGRLLYPAWPTCEQVVTWGLVVGFGAWNIFAVVPGLMAELTPALGLGLNAMSAPSASDWLLVGALLLVLTVGLWERLTQWRVLGILIVLAIGTTLVAQSSVAAASTLRWAAAAYLLLTACALWGRARLDAWARSLRVPLMETESSELAGNARNLTLLLAGVPLVGLTLSATFFQIGTGGWRVPGEWVFASFGAVVAYVVPLLVLSVVLVGYAVRERLPGFALAGSLVVNVATSLTFLNTLSAMTESAWVQLACINASTSAVFALGWLGAIAVRRAQAGTHTAEVSDALKLQVWLGAALIGLVIGVAGAAMVVSPTLPGAGRSAVGSVWGWLALGLSGAALAWGARLQRAPLGLAQSSAGLLAVGVLLACTVSRWDSGEWLGYHTLLVAAVTILALLLLAGCRQRIREAGAAATTIRLMSVFGALAFVLGARALAGDPQGPWWTVACFAVVSGVATGMAWLTSGRGYLYVAGVLVNLAVSAWHSYTHVSLSQGYRWELVAVNVIALALAGVVLFAFERRAMPDVLSSLPPYHHLASIVALSGVALPLLIGLVRDRALDGSLSDGRLSWIAVATTVVLMSASLWDATAKYAVGGLYVLGLLIAWMVLDQMKLQPRPLLFLGTMFMAGYAVMTSWLWVERGRLDDWAATLRMPRRAASAGDWLVWTNTLLIALLLLGGASIVLRFEVLAQRVSAALAVTLQVLSFVFLARGAAQRAWLQLSAFGSGIVGSVLLGWAFLSPGLDTNTITRLTIVLIVSVAAVELLGLWFVRRFANEWGAAAKRLLPPLSGIALLTLGGSMVNELAAQYSSGQVLLPNFAVLSVAVIVLGLSMQAIYFAVRAERDPLQLSERGRMNYVYASEALLGLALVHIRLTMPWLFSDLLMRYWPFVVMALAFAGVGLGELFQRRGQRVLGQPLLNTGFFLPLFPVVGFWVLASRTDYSGLLLLVGILYAIIAVLRGSFGVSLLACLAANGSLWYLLSRTSNFGVLERPQLWLTPVALSVLIAAHWNRQRLTAAQMTYLRYITLSLIYVSSTAEIFVRGVALSPWQPMVLLVLSAAGVLVGMWLRVRAFLFLGSSFVLIAMVSMIWHASASFGWTWLWYVTGIIAGSAIILLFAMFEKKRSELLRLVEGLRTWEA